MDMTLKIHKNSVFDNRMVIAILALIFVKPAYFEQITVINEIFIYLGLGITFLLLLYTVINIKIKTELLWLFVFLGYMLVVTIFRSGNVNVYLRAYYPILGLSLLFVICLEKNPAVLLDGLSFLGIYVYINLLTIIIFKDGMYRTNLYYQNWFLGYKNFHIRTILPVDAICLMRSFRRYNKLSFHCLILLICSLATLILNNSVTGLVGFLIFFALFLLFYKKDRLPKILTLFNWYLGTLIIFIGIAFLGMQFRFLWLLNFLGRDLTFTNRIGIWLASFEEISKKFLLGHGYLTADNYAAMLGGIRYTHPHNITLYLGMTGGILLIIIFVLGIIIASRRLNRNKESIYNKILLYLLCCFLFMGITESLTSSALFYPLLIMSMKSNKLNKTDQGG